MSSGLCGEAGFDEFGLDKREQRKCARLMFIVGWVMHDPALQNSTVLVLTDRNDLENQLFATVARCRDVLGEEPVQSVRLLSRADSGVWVDRVVQPSADVRRTLRMKQSVRS